MTLDDIKNWEKRNGRIPEGSVVFIRSDWSKEWPNPELAERKQFPGVTLAALKFLHLERHILFHGHEALDTDTTLTLEGEAWLLRNGYTQAEGVTNLDKVPEKGALVAIGFPKLGRGNRRIRPLHSNLPAGLEVWRFRWSGARSSYEKIGPLLALRRKGGNARSVIKMKPFCIAAVGVSLVLSLSLGSTNMAWGYSVLSV